MIDPHSGVFLTVMTNRQFMRGLGCGLAAAGMLLAGSGLPVAAEQDRVQIDALYSVELNRFEIGSFTFRSDLSTKTYALESNAEFSIAGLLGWKGQTRTQGALSGNSTSPALYQFDFESTIKSGSVAMNFKDRTVTGLTVLPAEQPLPGTVPLLEQHIKDVSDPLSAILSLVRAKGPNPCDRKVSIFDGKQRFDLVLYYRKKVLIEESQPSGQPVEGIVCKIKYVPIAGFRETQELRDLARNNTILITFRPVPSAGLMVPHAVRIPTAAGEAVISANKVTIKGPNQMQIALTN